MIGLVAALCLLGGVEGTSGEGVEAIRRFARVWSGTGELSYRLRKVERLRDGTVVEDLLRVKYRKPEAFYIADAKKIKGQEVIYDARQRVGELLVHPGRFPDVTLWLDIRGRLTLKGQRHPVNHSGFTYLLQHLLALVEGAREGAGVKITFGGERTWEGDKVREVKITAPASLRPGVAKKGETLWELARRFGADGYRIFEVNPGLPSLTAPLKEGAVYGIPNNYMPRVRLLFNSADGVLRLYQGWDGQGRLVEDYRFDQLNLQPGLTEMDFHEDNPAYRF